MKTRLFTKTCHYRDPLRVRGFRGRIAALTTCVAIGACLAVPVDAKVLDDFEDAAKSDAIWVKKCLFGACEQVVANGVATLAVTPDGDNGFSYLWSRERWTLQNGQTLEFRADLISSNGDGAVGYIGFALGDDFSMYVLGLDQDTIGMGKADGVIHLENDTPRKANNVKLILSMTGVGSDVWLRFKVLDNDNAGAVLFEREYWDTPEADPMHRGTDDPPANYLGRRGLFEVAVYHDNAGLFDPNIQLGQRERAEVVFDNLEVLEYATPVAKIEKSVCVVSWPEGTLEEQIVIGSSSLDTSAKWTPLPEPIFKRHGRLCVNVPITSTQQNFRIVPGIQFVDHFDPPKPPYAGRTLWVPGFYEPADATCWEVTDTDGVLRFHTLQIPVDGRALTRLPGPDLVVADFWASVDILHSDFSLLGTSFAIAARVGGDPGNWPGLNDGCIGGVAPDLMGVNQAQLFIRCGNADTYGAQFTIKPGTSYRLIFSGVGQQFSVEFVDLDAGQPAVDALVVTDSTFSQGLMALWFDVTQGMYDVTLDNFFVTGTKPESP
jgi:hypothetical protein